MKLKRHWRSIERNLNDYGLSETLSKLIRRIIAPIYENYTYRLYCIESHLKQRVRPESSPRFILRLVEPGDLPIIHQIEKIAEWLEGNIENLLKENYICVVALDGQKLAGFNLISLEYAHIPLLKLDWKLADDEAWSEQITVHNDYRRQGVGLALRQMALNVLKQRGRKKFCGGALISNVMSLNLAKKAGYTFTEDVQYLKILKYKKWKRREVIQ
jgi:ribosomal protein S18 acetylase RimI-like enzyme